MTLTHVALGSAYHQVVIVSRRMSWCGGTKSEPIADGEDHEALPYMPAIGVYIWTRMEFLICVSQADDLKALTMKFAE